MASLRHTVEQILARLREAAVALSKCCYRIAPASITHS